MKIIKKSGGGGSVTNTSVNTAIAANPAATRVAAGGSTTGGANTFPVLDGYGNLRMGGIITQASSLSGNAAFNGEHSILLGDQKSVLWTASDAADGSSVANFNSKGIGKLYSSIRYWRNHSGGQGEWNFDSNGRVCWYWNGGYQMGNANGGSHYLYWHSGYASALAPQRQSVPQYFNTATWTGSANVFNAMVMQARPLDTSGSNPELAIYRNGAHDPGVQDMDSTAAVKIVSMSKDGVWSAGTAPAFDALMDLPVVTQVCSKYKTVQTAKLTLGGNRTLAISGVEAGMRGVIYIKQDAAGSRTLTLPAGSATPAGFALSTVPFAIDRLQWEYDAGYFFWSITAGITAPLDADASAFISRASIINDTQKAAVNELVLKLKTAGVWEKLDTIYPFVGGNATAHSKNLKADSYNITWSGDPTHDTNGVTGDGVDAYGNTGWNPNAVGRNTSVSGYIYSRTSAPISGGYFWGATSLSARLGAFRNGSIITFEGPNNNATFSNNYPVFSGHLLIGRTDGSNAFSASNAIHNTFLVSGSLAPNLPVFLLARNANGPASGYTNANFAFAAFGQALTSGDYSAIRTAVDEFQTALGRANP